MAKIQVQRGTSFASSVLAGLGVPVTQDNISFINAWANREGGGGKFNPLNTTEPAANATNFNSIGVKNYPSLSEGIAATVQTLQANYYTDIVAALRTGKASTTQDFQGLRTWSGNGYSNLAGVSTSTNTDEGSGNTVVNTDPVGTGTTGTNTTNTGQTGGFEDVGLLSDAGGVASTLVKSASNPLGTIDGAFKGVDEFFTTLLWFADPVNWIRLTAAGFGMAFLLIAFYFIYKELK